MWRSVFAASLGAAYGAVAIFPMRERVADMLWQPTEAIAVGFVALSAALIAANLMACREPRRPGHQPPCCGACRRPSPPKSGSGVMPPRDALGRFAR